jgi:hypothetical protein
MCFKYLLFIVTSTAYIKEAVDDGYVLAFLMAVDVQTMTPHTGLCKVCWYRKKGHLMKNDIANNFELKLIFFLAVTRVIVTGKVEHVGQGTE